MTRPAPLVSGFLSLYDAVHDTWWFAGPFADAAAAAAWCAQCRDPAICVQSLIHDSHCAARWHLAPQVLDAATARLQGLCDDATDGYSTRIDPITPLTAEALESVIADLVDGFSDDLVADADAREPCGGGAPERRPQLADRAVVAQFKAVLYQCLDELRLTRCPRPWTEAELLARLAQLERWPGRQAHRACPLCAGPIAETAWLIAVAAEGDRRVLRDLMPQIPHAVCTACGLAEVGLAPHPSARRWQQRTHGLPPFAAAVLAEGDHVTEVAYEVDGRGWMVAIDGTWHALTGPSDEALRRWRRRVPPRDSHRPVQSA